ncbi:hypothetical protein GGR51DRAFT_155635 [Nemania sp. FL0031]|nr:hypothetical protein GGR51DRAFT_155635 [Nemania sp. FL0031]
MTTHLQGCVRTARTSGRPDHNLLYGFLTLFSGTWQFGYDVTNKEVTVNWSPTSSSRSSDSATARVTLRVWNVSWDVLTKNSSIRASGVKPVLEKEINLTALEASDDIFVESISIELDDFLIFDFEGTGSALGERRKIVDDDLSATLLATQTELEKTKAESGVNIASCRALYDAEKVAMQRAFDAEKAKLQDEIRAREADLQCDMQDKVSNLEQQFEAAMKELDQSKKPDAPVEELHGAAQDVDDALRQEIWEVSRQRDELEMKFQEREREAFASSQALQDAKRVNERQTGSIAALKAENAHVTAELANLLQAAVPTNKRLEAEVSSLRDAAKVTSAELEDEKMKAVDTKARLTRFESDNKRLGQELRKLKNDLAYSESTQSRLQGELDRAAVRLRGLEDDAGKRQKQVQQLTRDLRAEKASHGVAASELSRVKELMLRELSEADRNIYDLHIKIAGLESRVESMTEENNDLDAANSELKQRLLYESRELQEVRKDSERQRAEIDVLRSRVDAAEDQASTLKSDLSAAESGLESYQVALKNELARHANLSDSLKRESANSAEAKGRLEAFETTVKARMAKLTDGLEAARREAKQFSDSYTNAKADLEKAERNLATANFQAVRQVRLQRGETEQVEKLKADLEKAIQRELEYDPDQLYKQLDAQREALQTEKVEHVASVDRLVGDVQKCQNEIQRLEGEVASKDEGIRQCIDAVAECDVRLQQEMDANAILKRKLQDAKTQSKVSVTEDGNQKAQVQARLDLEISNHAATRSKLRQELDEKGALEREVRDLKIHVSQLSDSVFDERKSRRKTRSHLNLAVASQADMEEALSYERARADEYGAKLDRANKQFSQEQAKLSQVNTALLEAEERVTWVSSELMQKKAEVQQHKTTISNQQARIQVLERATKHKECVTLASVKELVGSYERLYDFALRHSSQKAWLRKAHYPDGFSWCDGRQEVGFRREQFPKSRKSKK